MPESPERENSTQFLKEQEVMASGSNQQASGLKWDAKVKGKFDDIDR